MYERIFLRLQRIRSLLRILFLYRVMEFLTWKNVIMSISFDVEYWIVISLLSMCQEYLLFNIVFAR